MGVRHKPKAKNLAILLAQEPGRRSFMKCVTGIGGIFFKSENPGELYRWYEEHLGIQRMPDGSGAIFEWRDVQENKKGMTVWSIFRANRSISIPAQMAS